MNIPAQLRDAARAARAAKWTIEKDGHDHLRWTNPEGKWTWTSGTNIGCGHTVANYLSDLARLGLDIPSRRRPPKKKRGDHVTKAGRRSRNAAA